MPNCRLYHLAGIIPVEFGGIPSKDYILHPALTLVADKLTTVEQAVMTAAKAGCKTIWIVLQDCYIPLFKEVLGEWVLDSNTSWSKIWTPMFYIPVPLHGYNYRHTSLPLSIMRGIKASHKFSALISTWAVPDAYFISFPQSICDMSKIREQKKDIVQENTCFFSYQNKTVKDNLYLPFVINREKDYKELYDFFSPLTKKHEGIDRIFNMSIMELMSKLTPKENDKTFNIDWYYSIDTWNGYCSFLGSQHSKLITVEQNVGFTKFKNKEIRKKISVIGGNLGELEVEEIVRQYKIAKEIPKEKICPVCGENKKAEEYTRDKRDGLEYMCKACVKKKNYHGKML